MITTHTPVITDVSILPLIFIILLRSLAIRDISPCWLMLLLPCYTPLRYATLIRPLIIEMPPLR